MENLKLQIKEKVLIFRGNLSFSPFIELKDLTNRFCKLDQVDFLLSNLRNICYYTYTSNKKGKYASAYDKIKSVT